MKKYYYSSENKSVRVGLHNVHYALITTCCLLLFSFEN